MNNQVWVYAVSRTNSIAEIPDLPDGIERQIFGELTVFFSRNNEISPDIESLKKYHDIISQLHSAITIIPFRYGSFSENMQTWIEEESENHLELLARLDGLTEMSLRIIVPQSESQDSAKPLSGKDYLLRKAKEFGQNEKGLAVIEMLKTELHEFIRDFKHEKRGEILSVYFLIKKTDVQSFRQKFAEIEKGIGFKSVLTSGWCPFNFCTNDV